jgi:phosphatidylinositol-bisphosphatase
MKVSPTYGMLIPGDQPLTLNIAVTINNRTAHMLNSGREVLDDILILRLENGRDYYITVKANYARSCFGMSAEELVLYSEAIRNVPLDPIKRAETMDPKSTTVLCVPKELWRVVDAIYEKGLQEPHLFVEPGQKSEVDSIREALDTGVAFGTYRIHSYAEVLVTFLESLSTPIVPWQLFPTQEIDSLTIQSSARRLLEELPPVHYNIFVYVISFFREVLVHRERNLLSAVKVARICCSCMASGKGLDDSNASLQKRTGMQLYVLYYHCCMWSLGTLSHTHVVFFSYRIMMHLLETSSI